MKFSVGHSDSKIIPESVKRHMIQCLSCKNKGWKEGEKLFLSVIPLLRFLEFSSTVFSLESYILLKDLSIYETIFSEKSAY